MASNSLRNPVRQNRTSGFSITHITVAIAVAALIIGIVFIGENIVYSARLRSVASELEQIQGAVATFKTKYDCLPGDCVNATTFLGLDPKCPDGGKSLTGTCNGDGDGIINGAWQHGQPVESLFVFQQLALSNIIQPKKYPGSNKAFGVEPGFQVPRSSFEPYIGYYVLSPDPSPDLHFPSSIVSKVHVMIGAKTAPGGWDDYLMGAGFNAIDAHALDSKIDDGNPTSGQIIAVKPQPGLVNKNTTCFTDDGYETLSNSGCVLFYDIKL